MPFAVSSLSCSPACGGPYTDALAKLMGVPMNNGRDLSANPTVPRYQQVKEHILSQIRAGQLRPHDRVPSEQELVTEFGVSRMTANRALRELAGDGVVVRQAGVGTFVADSQIRSPVMQVRNIADEIRERGHVHRAEVRILEHIDADNAITQSLELASGASVFHSVIVHFENDRPIQLEDRYVRVDVAPEYGAQDFSRITPNEYLTAVAPLQTAEHVVRAECPEPEVRDSLRMAAGEPCLVIRRRTWSDDRPVSIAHLYHPGFRYELAARFRPGAAVAGQWSPVVQDTKGDL